MESSGNRVLSNFIEVAMREKGFKVLYGRAWAWAKCNIKLEVISLVSTSALYVIFGFVVIVVAVKGDLNFALYTIIPHADLKNLYFNLGFIAWGGSSSGGMDFVCNFSFPKSFLLCSI